MGKKLRFSNIGDYLSDEDSEVNGIELSFGKGRFITVARSGGRNRRYRTEFVKVYEPRKREIDRGTIDDEVSASLLREVFAKGVVLGWRGWLGADGKEIPYSVDAAMDLFEEAPEIFNAIRDEADKFSNFALEQAEEAGNE